MKCPKCNSINTKKVSVMRSNWKLGAHICNDCNYQDHWGEFCEPPLRIKFEDPKIILPGTDEEQ